jgi:hypothetical protein
MAMCTSGSNEEIIDRPERWLLLSSQYQPQQPRGQSLPDGWIKRSSPVSLLPDPQQVAWHDRSPRHKSTDILFIKFKYTLH